MQILTALEEYENPKIRESVERFLEDVNEPSRFHAVNALFAQGDPAALPALLRLVAEEESVRVRTKIAEGLAARAWDIPPADRDALAKALPPAYAVDAKSHVVKR